MHAAGLVPFGAVNGYGKPMVLGGGGVRAAVHLHEVCMWVRERTVWKGPWAFLAAPRGIVQAVNKAECNTGYYHKQLDVCSACVLFFTTPWKHGSMARKLQEEIEISSLNFARISCKIHIQGHMPAHM